MSVNYTAYVVHGVAVPVTALSGRVRGCSHPQRSVKFCPDCGKPMWIETEIKEELELSQAFRVGDVGWIHREGAPDGLVGIVLASMDGEDMPWHKPVDIAPDARALAAFADFCSKIGVSIEGARLHLAFTAG